MGKDRTGKLDVMLGVNDKDLKTPKHDELCLWVDKNYIKIITDKLDINRNVFLNQIYFEDVVKEGSGKPGVTCKNMVDDENYNVICKHLNKKCVINENGLDKKCPFYDNIKSQYDVAVDKINDGTLDELYIIDFLWEEPIKAPPNGFIVGIPDFTINLRLKNITISGICGCETGWEKRKKIYVEVKPKIHSIGETMRQLKLYKSYMRDHEFDNYIILVSGSNNLDVFERQGIKTFVVTDEMLTKPLEGR